MAWKEKLSEEKRQLTSLMETIDFIWIDYREEQNVVETVCVLCVYECLRSITIGVHFNWTAPHWGEKYSKHGRSFIIINECVLCVLECLFLWLCFLYNFTYLLENFELASEAIYCCAAIWIAIVSSLPVNLSNAPTFWTESSVFKRINVFACILSIGIYPHGSMHIVITVKYITCI